MHKLLKTSFFSLKAIAEKKHHTALCKSQRSCRQQTVCSMIKAFHISSWLKSFSDQIWQNISSVLFTMFASWKQPFKKRWAMISWSKRQSSGMKSPAHIKYNGLRIFTVKAHGEPFNVHTGRRGTEEQKTGGGRKRERSSQMSIRKVRVIQCSWAKCQILTVPGTEDKADSKFPDTMELRY